MTVNKLCYGFSVSADGKTISKARMPGKQSASPSSLPLTDDQSAFNLLTPAAQTATAPLELKSEFESFDSSSISIKEVSSDLQETLAVNGFSASSLSASASVASFVFSA